MRAQFVLSEIGSGLRRNLTMTLAVVVTVAVSLALFGLALILQDTVNRMNHYYYGKLTVSVYLKKDVTQAERDEISSTLAGDPLVKSYLYESSQQALVRFRQEFRDQPALVALANQRPDSLPESFRVQLKDPRQFADLATEFANSPGVESVVDQGAILHKIFAIFGGIRTAAIVLALVQILGAVLLIGNTIRLTAFSRRRETGIMRLVGASNLYIQLPFLLEGAVAGLLGGVAACGALIAAKRFLFDGALAGLFRNSPIPDPGWDRVIVFMPLLLLLGVGVSAVAAFVTLRRHLRV
ncbi:MAG: permease-like cell division protein FtsX [Mycobacteriales bacterium]